jgi:hypothetical protein
MMQHIRNDIEYYHSAGPRSVKKRNVIGLKKVSTNVRIYHVDFSDTPPYEPPQICVFSPQESRLITFPTLPIRMKSVWLAAGGHQ